MKLKIALAILVMIFYANNTNAQNNLDKITGLNSTTASVAYSLRLLSNSYTGPLIRIKVGTLFYDVYPDASNKFSLSSKISASVSTYNAAAAVASVNALGTIITATTDATVAIWYDQSGYAVNVLSSSATAKIVTAGVINTMNGQPSIYFNGTSSYLISTSTVNYSAQTTATINAIVQNVASTNSVSGIYSTGITGGWGVSYDPASLGYWLDGSGCSQASTGVTSTTGKIITGFLNKSTNASLIYENSVLKGTKTMTCSIMNGTADQVCIGIRASNGGTRQFKGNISEVILLPAILSTTDQALLESNQTQAYFSPTVTITSSASGAVCSGTNVTFTSNVYNYTSTPTYQWYKNNIAISGATSSTFSTSSLSNNDVIKVSAGDVMVANSLIQNLDANNVSSYSSGNTWTDLSGSGNNGTINTMSTGSVVITTESAIKSFNYTKGLSYISAPLTKSASMTFNVWAKTSSLTNYYSGTMLFNAGASGTGPLTGGPDLFINANKLFWNTYDAASNPFQLNGTDITTTSASIHDNNWHNFTVVVDAVANNASLYIDGVFKGVAVYKDPRAYSSTALFIGGEGNNANITNYNLAWDGNISAFQTYSRALSLSEVVQNFNSKAAFFGANSAALITSNNITTTVNTSPLTPLITVIGDGCVNKTTLTTSSGLTAYAWYKDDVVISGATSNTFTPTSSGSYKVQVTSGSCANTSTVTTIYTCGKNSDGRMIALESSTTLVSANGAINSGKGVDDRGMLLTKLLAPTGTNPITNGLVLYLDATRTASYSGTGTTWNDISGQNNTATLVGNPVLSSNPASFTFATNTYASTAKSDIAMSSATFIAWVNPSQIQTGLTGIIFNRSGNFGSTAPATGLDFSNNNAIGYHWNDLPASYNWNSGISVPINTWSLIALTITSSTATVYLFNASSPSGSSAVNTLTHTALSGLNFIIANEPGGPGRTFLGKIGTSMVYTTALSSADITSIFNAQKAAFGL